LLQNIDKTINTPPTGDVIDAKENAPFENKSLDEILKEPLPLKLSQFEWIETDLDDPQMVSAKETAFTHKDV